MTRKILGTVLLLLGALVGIVLLTYGGPVFPHIIGPIVFIGSGAFFLISRKKTA